MVDYNAILQKECPYAEPFVNYPIEHVLSKFAFWDKSKETALAFDVSDTCSQCNSGCGGCGSCGDSTLSIESICNNCGAGCGGCNSCNGCS